MACIYTELSTVHQKCYYGYFCCPHPEPTGAASGSTLLTCSRMSMDLVQYSECQITSPVYSLAACRFLGLADRFPLGWKTGRAMGTLLLTCSVDSATQPLAQPHSWYSHTACTSTLHKALEIGFSLVSTPMEFYFQAALNLKWNLKTSIQLCIHSL